MTASGPSETPPTPGSTSNTARLASLNPLTPENLDNPVPLYTELREHDPVHWSEALQSWFITRHDDVTNCFRHPRLSANRTALYAYQMQSLEQGFVQEFVQLTGRMMMNRDGMDHIGIRRQASSGFTPQILDTYRPSIRRVMGTLMDGMRDRDRMDVVKEISQQLPSLVIADFLGIPAEDQRRFLSWTQPLNDFFSPPPGTDMVKLASQTNDAMRALRDYLAGVIEHRRQHPGHDMISHMLHAQQAGKMSLDELVANAILMVTAGYATTLEQLSNGVHDLLSNPDQFQKLKQNPSLVHSAVEEMLRFNPAAPFMTRIAADDIELHGRTIKKGSLVFLGMASANRDPKVFSDPDRFDITRDHVQQKHLSFAFGAHHCLGAGLARRELEVAIEVLIERIPGMRLDEANPPKHKNQGIIFRGFESLVVRW